LPPERVVFATYTGRLDRHYEVPNTLQFNCIFNLRTLRAAAYARNAKADLSRLPVHKCRFIEALLLRMTKSDVQCPHCSAGYRRIELTSRKSQPGSYSCALCKQPLEEFDGGSEVVYRLTVVPTQYFEAWGQALSKVTSSPRYRRSGRMRTKGQASSERGLPG
jgi:DNA-directed RNA polymerase subunit RPC12/RpoP